jgi:hypothetical protein
MPPSGPQLSELKAWVQVYRQKQVLNKSVAKLYPTVELYPVINAVTLLKPYIRASLLHISLMQ